MKRCHRPLLPRLTARYVKGMIVVTDHKTGHTIHIKAKEQPSA